MHFYILVLNPLTPLAPYSVLYFYLVLSIVTFCAYFFAKLAAQTHTSRISENTLDSLSFLGGWPGALLAQNFWRHKSKKRSFQIVFWVTTILNVGLLGCAYSNQGRSFIQAIYRIGV